MRKATSTLNSSGMFVFPRTPRSSLDSSTPHLGKQPPALYVCIAQPATKSRCTHCSRCVGAERPPPSIIPGSKPPNSPTSLSQISPALDYIARKSAYSETPPMSNDDWRAAVGVIADLSGSRHDVAATLLRSNTMSSIQGRPRRAADLASGSPPPELTLGSRRLAA